MGFAPSGLKVGDIYENDNGQKVRVVRVDVNPSYIGYETEPVEEAIEEAVEGVEEAPKKRAERQVFLKIHICKK